MSSLKEFNTWTDLVKKITIINFGAEYFDYEEETYLRRVPRWKKVALGLFHLNFIIKLFDLVGAMIANKEDLILFLSLMMYVFLALGSMYTNYIQLVYRKFICFGVTQCRDVHRLKNVFIRRYCSDKINAAGENSTKLAKILCGLCIFAFISVLIMGTATTYFFQEPEYPLPLPSFLFGIRPTSTSLYIVNWISQLLFFIVAVDAYCGTVCCGLISAVYALLRFDATIELTKEINTITKEAEFKEYCRLVSDLMSVSRESLSKWSDATTGLFFFMQIQSYVTLFTCWLIFDMDKSGILRIIPGLVILIGLFLCVVFNEAFIEKFDDLLKTFYEAEWYTMPPKDREAFVIFLSMAQKPITLSAGGINVLTLDWFSNLFKQAYQMALYIGDRAV